jgi:hypothetical protein
MLNPGVVYPNETDVLAVHWHPEFVPEELACRRVNASFPLMRNSLIIPTQHNEIRELNGFSGVEVDCFSPEFNRKVQLLFHFKGFDGEKGTKLVSMIEHTFRYRSNQMHEFLAAICDEKTSPAMESALGKTRSSRELEQFVRIQTHKFLMLIRQNEGIINAGVIKNKLLRNFFDELRLIYDGYIIDLSQILIRSVKEHVKKEFSNDFFFRTSEIIEEARAMHAGIIIPHPEQFWPVLLAEYDVDGYEVWNPQSREFTEFLIEVVGRKNSALKHGQRRILVLMGDDTHLGEKARPLELQDREKAGREIGVQTAWEEPGIKKMLAAHSFTKEKIINEYRSRL